MKMKTKKHFPKKILLLKCYENETKYIKGEFKNFSYISQKWRLVKKNPMF